MTQGRLNVAESQIPPGGGLVVEIAHVRQVQPRLLLLICSTAPTVIFGASSLSTRAQTPAYGRGAQPTTITSMRLKRPGRFHLRVVVCAQTYLGARRHSSGHKVDEEATPKGGVQPLMWIRAVRRYIRRQ